jgi:hypothetical protein
LTFLCATSHSSVKLGPKGTAWDQPIRSWLMDTICSLFLRLAVFDCISKNSTQKGGKYLRTHSI